LCRTVVPLGVRQLLWLLLLLLLLLLLPQLPPAPRLKPTFSPFPFECCKEIPPHSFPHSPLRSLSPVREGFPK